MAQTADVNMSHQSRNYSVEFQSYIQEPTINQYYHNLCNEHGLSHNQAIEYIHQQWLERRKQQQQQPQPSQPRQMNNNMVCMRVANCVWRHLIC